MAERTANPRRRTVAKPAFFLAGAAVLLLLALPFLAGWIGIGRVSLPAGATARAVAAVRRDKKKPVYIGTPLRYTVLVEARAPRIDPPAWPKTRGDPGYELRLVRAGGLCRLLGGTRRTFQYELVFYRTGTVVVPGPAGIVRQGAVKHKYQANALRVPVRSLLPKGKAGFSPQDLRESKPPVDLPYDWRVLAAVIPGLAVLAAAILLLARFLRRAGGSDLQAARTVAAEPAYLAALRELDAIRLWPEEGECRAEAFFVRLSACIRRYLMDRFGLKAPELTTEEWLPLAARDLPLPGGAGGILADLASCWDRVKFARHLPPAAAMREAWRQAYAFVDLTKDEPPRENEDGSGAALTGEVVS